MPSTIDVGEQFLGGSLATRCPQEGNSRQIPANRNIRADQLICLTSARTQADYPELLGRVVVWDAENECEIVLLTNLLEFGSSPKPLARPNSF